MTAPLPTDPDARAETRTDRDAVAAAVHPGVAREKLRRPYELGRMPLGRAMTTVDEAIVAAPVSRIFALAWQVEEWPTHLSHYRFVKFRTRGRDGGGLVEMSANRPFGAFDWPTWWLSEMEVRHDVPSVRFRHVDGITKGMEVEWTFDPIRSAPPDAPRTQVRIVHLWDGPKWPVIGLPAALAVIGPVFVHGIASRTLAGLQRVAEAR